MRKYITVSPSGGDWTKGYLVEDDGSVTYLGEGHSEDYFQAELLKHLGCEKGSVEISEGRYDKNLGKAGFFEQLAAKEAKAMDKSLIDGMTEKPLQT